MIAIGLCRATMPPSSGLNSIKLLLKKWILFPKHASAEHLSPLCVSFRGDESLEYSGTVSYCNQDIRVDMMKFWRLAVSQGAYWYICDDTDF